MADADYDISSLRMRPRKEKQSELNEPKTKDELLAVIWGLTQGDPPEYREAAIWYVLSSNEDSRLDGVFDQWGQRNKAAVGSDRDPWGGTAKAVRQLEARGINTLASIVRRYIDGESPSPAVQAEIDQIRANLSQS
jgi:hypothetical protein